MTDQDYKEALALVETVLLIESVEKRAGEELSEQKKSLKEKAWAKILKVFPGLCIVGAGEKRLQQYYKKLEDIDKKIDDAWEKNQGTITTVLAWAITKVLGLPDVLLGPIQKGLVLDRKFTKWKNRQFMKLLKGAIKLVKTKGGFSTASEICEKMKPKVPSDIKKVIQKGKSGGEDEDKEEKKEPEKSEEKEKKSE